MNAHHMASKAIAYDANYPYSQFNYKHTANYSITNPFPNIFFKQNSVQTPLEILYTFLFVTLFFVTIRDREAVLCLKIYSWDYNS